jgi:LPXTG-site transpeptidase (sortase) family protein
MRRIRRGKRNQEKGSLIGFVFIFLIGVGILFYPTMSYWLAQRNHIVAHQTYERNVAELSAQEKRTMWEVAVHYNERLLNSVVEDPFASTENIDPFDEYYQTLDVGDGVMGYIHILELAVLLPIYHGVSEEVLDKGVGHIHASALPVGGEGTHAVLTGHTGLSNAKMFDDLVEIRQGDEFYLEILDETLAYEVTSIQVVLPDDVSSLHREDGKDKVTLVTCTPYGVNSHRLLVTGERIPYTGEMQKSREGDKSQFPWWILIVVLLVVSVVLVIGKKRNKEKSER